MYESNDGSCESWLLATIEAKSTTISSRTLTLCMQNRNTIDYYGVYLTVPVPLGLLCIPLIVHDYCDLYET